MSLFIKVIEGQVVDHPVTWENLQMVYPGIESSHPPDHYWPFNRASIPVTPDPYTINEVDYVISHSVVNEVYTQRPMTQQEKQNLWTAMEQQKPFHSWILDTEMCIWRPPVSHPQDGKKYHWNEDQCIWSEIPPSEQDK